MTTNQFPESLIAYYRDNTDKFEERTNVAKKYTYYGLTALCVLLIIVPGIIPIGPWIVRVIAIIGLIYFGLGAMAGGIDFFNKASDGMIKDCVHVKFDMNECDEDEIIDAFNRKDFDFLADAPQADNQPLQLYVEEDEKGKEFYCFLRKFFTSSDFRGVTEVIILAGDEYDQWKKVFKSM